MYQHFTIDARMVSASGIGTYIRNVLPILIGAHPEVTFNLLGDLPLLQSMPWTHAGNVTVTPAHYPIYSVSEQLKMVRSIPEATDLYWVPHYNVPIAFRGPLAVTVHDVFPLAHPQMLGRLHKRVVGRLLFRKINRAARIVLTGSRFAANQITQHGGVDANRIRIAPYGVDDGWYEVEKSATAIHPKPYLVYVGNVKPHKNLRSLIKAFAQVAASFDHDLLIVGKKDGFLTGDKDIEQAVGRLGERIRFTGYVSEPELRQYVKQAEGFVFPSKYEGFGLPPLEAMACGTPCLVSRAASLPEVCGDAPIYCDPFDIDDIASGIITLVCDQEVRAQCRDRGVRQARKYRWDRAASLTWEGLMAAAGNGSLSMAGKM